MAKSTAYTERDEYKDNPLIRCFLSEDDQKGKAFGITNARRILANVADIRQFVNEHYDGSPAPKAKAKRKTKAKAKKRTRR